VLVGFSKTVVIAVAASLLGAGALRAQQAQPQWKDRAEYDLAQAAQNEKDPHKRLELLNQWKEKYPNSEVQATRLYLFLTTYQALNQPLKVYETAKEMAALDASNVNARYFICVLGPTLTKPTPEDFDTIDKAAKSLLASLDTAFAPDKRPQNLSEQDWKKRRVEAEALAYKAEGWVAMQKKENDRAETALRKSLELNPESGDIAYWLGTMLLAEKRPEKNSDAIFFFARAAYYDGPGSLNPQGRTAVTNYIEKLYKSFHGSDEGLDDLRKLAKAQALPPADFKVKSSAEIALEQEEKLKKENPALALWLNIKRELTGPGGDAYWGNMKGALIPGDAVPGVTKLKGKLVSQKPPKNPKELVLAMSDGITPEVTLVLDEPLRGAAEAGTEISFEGIATNFTKDPFMLTFEVEKAKLVGWPAPAPPAKKAPVRKKAPARKK
jgi:hypothetical protein